MIRNKFRKLIILGIFVAQISNTNSYIYAYSNANIQENIEIKEKDIQKYLSEMDIKINRLNTLKKEYPDSKTLEERINTAVTCYNNILSYQRLYLGANNDYDISAGSTKEIYNLINKERLKQLIISDYNQCMNINEDMDIFYDYLEVDNSRKNFVTNALSLEGKITYQWNGKPMSKGWNENWNNINGLDCSGFVAWAYWTTFDEKNDAYMSTCSITHSLEQIDHAELLPGDLGTIIDDGTYYLDANNKKFYNKADAENSNKKIADSIRKKKIERAVLNEKKENPKLDVKKTTQKYSKTIKVTPQKVKTYANHVGIYVGKDEDGNELWVHCNNKDKTVSVNEGCFKYYYRLSIPK